MDNFVKVIKQAAALPVTKAHEHHPQRARFLRAEISRYGKPMYQLTADELVRINQKVDEQLK